MFLYFTNRSFSLTAERQGGVYAQASTQGQSGAPIPKIFETPLRRQHERPPRRRWLTSPAAHARPIEFDWRLVTTLRRRPFRKE